VLYYSVFTAILLCWTFKWMEVRTTGAEVVYCGLTRSFFFQYKTGIVYILLSAVVHSRVVSCQIFRQDIFLQIVSSTMRILCYGWCAVCLCEHMPLVYTFFCLIITPWWRIFFVFPRPLYTAKYQCTFAGWHQRDHWKSTRRRGMLILFVEQLLR
jgi:hypothetical protein